jgi:hypothetical protein
MAHDGKLLRVKKNSESGFSNAHRTERGCRASPDRRQALASAALIVRSRKRYICVHRGVAERDLATTILRAASRLVPRIPPYGRSSRREAFVGDTAAIPSNTVADGRGREPVLV